MGGIRESLKKSVDFFVEVVGLRKTDVEEDALSKKELGELFSLRRPFSKYVVPIAYDEEREVYYNQDGTIGIAFECVPLLFVSETGIKTLSSVFSLPFPKGTVIQFMLVADPFIDLFLEYFVRVKAQKARNYSYLDRAFRNQAKFYKTISTRLGFPARNFRVFFTVKFSPHKNFTDDQLKELKTAIREILKATGLYVIDLKPEDLLFFMRYLLNDVSIKCDEFDFTCDDLLLSEEMQRYRQWIPTLRLNRQVLFSHTEVEFSKDKIQFGSKKFRCLTWKAMPNTINSNFGNFLSGVYDLTDGIAGDGKQVVTPFMIVFNVFTDSINTEIQAKANLTLQQQPIGTYVVSLRERIDEFLWAVKEINDGRRFKRGFLSFWVWSDDEDELRTSLYKYQRILESLGGIVQEEVYVAPILFVYSLPFGAVSDKKNLALLDRDFVFTEETAACSAPIQADYMGTGEPVLLFVGRKGQVVGLDLFSPKTSSYNFFVVAPTGSGKSFLVNYMVANYYGAGAKIRIIDVGGSYKKLVNMFNGRFLEFSPESSTSINPFASIHDPEYDVPVITQLITAMATAVTEKLPEDISSETAYNMVQMAVREVLKWAEADDIPYSRLSIDHVYEVLANFMKYFPDADKICEKDYCIDSFERISSHLAFNLHKFTSEGIYGKYFVGESTFDISKDDFVVLELEHLKNFPDLFKVVILAVLNAVTSDLYLSDRERPTLIVLDEAWQFLQDSPAFEKVIEEGYRRARKYRGSFGIVTQDLLDFESFGRVGRVIFANSAFRFYLSGVKAELARERKVVDVDDFTVKVLKSLRYNAPKYSEIFVWTKDIGMGVVRLVVDPYSYYVYTSNPIEVAEIEKLVRSGMSYEEAIEEMIRCENENKKDS